MKKDRTPCTVFLKGKGVYITAIRLYTYYSAIPRSK